MTRVRRFACLPLSVAATRAGSRTREESFLRGCAANRSCGAGRGDA
ncbi:MAG: hypothetical protein LBP38_04150 [Desulfovibrio sp.]|nr:hypothetical protein [Desulfovibrio sp.]